MRPGDTLRLEGEIIEITASRSKPQGNVRMKLVLFNQDNEAVYTITALMIVPRRPG